MSTAPKQRFTPQEYLALERAAASKSEYFGGEIFAMAGASREHSLIASNLVRELGDQLRETPCEVHGSDLRVKVAATGLYTYPDVTIACGELHFDDESNDTLLNPRVIFEVLSPSSEAYDRGKKFDHYRQMPALTEYVLVSQSEPLVERYVRQPDGSWRLTVFKGLAAAFDLESVPCRIALSDVYIKVAFRGVGQ